MAAIAVLLVACSPAGSASTDPATSAPAVTRSAEAAPAVSASPREAAVAAYETYTDAVVTALREGNADLPALDATAAARRCATRGGGSPPTATTAWSSPAT